MASGEVQQIASVGITDVVPILGLMIHGGKADRNLRGGQEDLIAVGREFLNNPIWPWTLP